MTLLRDQRLRVFHAVATYKSFSKAAQHLCLTQQAVSSQVRSLEKDAGLRLFTRGHRFTELTTAGRTLFAHADRILALYAEANESFGEIAHTAQSTLRISATNSIAKYTLPQAISDFRSLHPAVRVVLEVGNSANAIDRLMNGSVDMAITSEGAPGLARFHTTPFFRDEVLFVASKHHPWALKKQVTMKDLLETPLIMREEGSATRALLQRHLSSLGLSLDSLKVALVAGSPEAAKEAAEAGIGVAVISMLCARSTLQADKLVSRQIEQLPIVRDFCIARHERGTPSPIAAEFIAAARQSAA
ncbi:MAG: LysR substrate-binding domain-containing protein [Pseudomonadota bacterium]|nr:LysR substrate-binding domain-containing protein [Pseudomonadota bacterium]